MEKQLKFSAGVFFFHDYRGSVDVYFIGKTNCLVTVILVDNLYNKIQMHVSFNLCAQIVAVLRLYLSKNDESKLLYNVTFCYELH